MVSSPESRGSGLATEVFLCSDLTGDDPLQHVADTLLDLVYGLLRRAETLGNLPHGVTLQEPLENLDAAGLIRLSDASHAHPQVMVHPFLFPPLVGSGIQAGRPAHFLSEVHYPLMGRSWTANLAGDLVLDYAAEVIAEPPALG